MKFAQAIASFVVTLACLQATSADAQQPRRPLGKPQQEQPKPSAEPEKLFPYGATWVLQEFNGKPVPAGVDATLTIDGNNHGSGSAGCNTWSSPMVAAPGQRLIMGAIAMTRKSCPPATMSFERSYLTVLHSAPQWDLAVTDLVVKSPAASMRFKRGL